MLTELLISGGHRDKKKWRQKHGRQLAGVQAMKPWMKIREDYGEEEEGADDATPLHTGSSGVSNMCQGKVWVSMSEYQMTTCLSTKPQSRRQRTSGQRCSDQADDIA